MLEMELALISELKGGIVRENRFPKGFGRGLLFKLINSGPSTR